MRVPRNVALGLTPRFSRVAHRYVTAAAATAAFVIVIHALPVRPAPHCRGECLYASSCFVSHVTAAHSEFGTSKAHARCRWPRHGRRWRIALRWRLRLRPRRCRRVVAHWLGVIVIAPPSASRAEVRHAAANFIRPACGGGPRCCLLRSLLFKVPAQLLLAASLQLLDLSLHLRVLSVLLRSLCSCGGVDSGAWRLRRGCSWGGSGYSGGCRGRWWANPLRPPNEIPER